MRKRAAEAEPGIPDRWHQLGVAYYRAGNWEATLEIFPARITGSAWQWLWMAMAHWQLDHKDEARRWYYLSLDWMATAQEKRLRDVQAEAAAVLELPDPGERSEQALDYTRREAYSKAIDLYEKLMVDFPAVPAYRTKLIELLNKTGRGKDVERVNREAISALEKLAANHPKNSELTKDLAQLLVTVGRNADALALWGTLAAQAEQLVAKFPSEVPYQRSLAVACYWHALALLGAGDTKGYGLVCAPMLQRFKDNADTEAAFWVVWTCALAPGAVGDWGPAIILAEKNLAADSKNCDKLQVLGAVLYRAGRFEDAAKRLTEAESAFKDAKAPRSAAAYTWLFLAMAHQRLGRLEEAEKQFDQALAEIEKWTAQGSQNPGNTWNRRLTFSLLTREAKELLSKETGKQK
jgi:tetratricopeptide (TPR) repeat protein